MRNRLLPLLMIGAGLLMYAGYHSVNRHMGCAEAQEADMTTDAAATPRNLLVVWTSADPEVAENMVFMYTYNARTRGWWEGGAIRLLVWGPSQKLLVENAAMQQSLARIVDVGVEVLACRACAENYGIADDLRELGVDVHYTGTDLTDMLKDGWTVITF